MKPMAAIVCVCVKSRAREERIWRERGRLVEESWKSWVSTGEESQEKKRLHQMELRSIDARQPPPPLREP